MNRPIKKGLGAALVVALLFSFQALADETQGNSDPAKQENPTTSDTLKKDGTEKTPGINRVQKKEAQRIKEGVKSGELTGEETQELKQDQKMIQEQKHEAKADGKVTKKEKKEIRKAQKKAGKKIAEKKRNNEKRPSK